MFGFSLDEGRRLQRAKRQVDGGLLQLRAIHDWLLTSAMCSLNTQVQRCKQSGPASTITAPSSKLNWIITGSQEVHSFIEFSDLDSPKVVALRGWSNPWLRPFPLTEERYVSPGLALYDITKD